MELIVITGMSGAGKTCVIDGMEDLGFFCIDNLPAELIPTIAQLNTAAGEYNRVAVVCDVRSGDVMEQKLTESLKALDALKIDYKLMFIDADDSVLLRRFKETRRPHPLSDNGRLSLSQAIERERKLLQPLKEAATLRLATTNLSAPQCRARVIGMFSDPGDGEMRIHFMSFGFKHGIPSDADFVFDLRMLPNPFYIQEFKPKTGLDDDVVDYIMSFSESRTFLESIQKLLAEAIPLCKNEGRTQLIIGCGCTGGHHRSVTFARLLERHFAAAGEDTSISHRDILK